MRNYDSIIPGSKGIAMKEIVLAAAIFICTLAMTVALAATI